MGMEVYRVAQDQTALQSYYTIARQVQQTAQGADESADGIARRTGKVVHDSHSLLPQTEQNRAAHLAAEIRDDNRATYSRLSDGNSLKGTLVDNLI